MRLATFCLCGLVFPLGLAADEYHYKNLLVGTKAIGLGGAYTAISDDLSAVFFNPAGISKTEESNSASISTFAWEKTTFKDVFSSGDDFSRSSFSIVPSFLGLGGAIDKHWHWSLGFAVSDLSTERNYNDFSYPIPDAENNPIGQVKEFAFVDLDNAIYELGIGTGYTLDESSSIGASVIFKYKSFNSVQGSGLNSEVFTPDFTIYQGFTASRRLKDEIITVAPSIGYLNQFGEYKFGVKVSKDFTINRSYSSTSSIFVTSTIPVDFSARPSLIETIRGDEAQEYATNVSVGIARFFENFEFSFDIDYFEEVVVDDFYIIDEQPAITRDMQEVVNYSLGLTYHLTDESYFRFGLFTDKANSAIDPEKRFQRTEVIDLVGLSMDYTSNFFGFPLSFGAYVKHGEGEVRVSDIRAVESLVGIPLYPPSDNYDTADAEKSLLVLFISANF